MQQLRMHRRVPTLRRMTIRDQTRAVRQGSFGWMIQRLARQVERRMEAALTPQGLTIREFAILMMVLEADRPSQARIGAQFAMPAYAISRALDGLEAKGLVERQPDPASRRSHVIVPTGAARDIAPALHRTIEEVNARILSRLSPDEALTFVQLTQRVLAGLAVEEG